MRNKSAQSIVVALLISAALIGLAFYQRHGGSIPVPEFTLYLAAAVIWVSPRAYRALRYRKDCGNKAVNAG